MSTPEQHQNCTNRFVELANKMKDEGLDPSLISGALMTASGIYATYLAAGNNAALEPSGVDKVCLVYRNTLERFQSLKKDQLMKQALK